MAKDAGNSRTDTIVKVMLVFFISLLSFSVGTFVGKQVSDSDHRRLALESEFKDGREVASQDDDKDGSKVSEKDVDTLADEFVNKEKPAAEDGKVAAKEDADGYKAYPKDGKDEEASATGKKETKMEKKSKADTMDTGDKVANNEAPSDGQAEERKPSSAALPGVASSAVGQFTVQVASYATEDEAKAQAMALKTKGWEAFYIPAAIGGKTWYRVSIGVFKNHTAASAFRKQFLKESGNKSALIQKIVQ